MHPAKISTVPILVLVLSSFKLSFRGPGFLLLLTGLPGCFLSVYGGRCCLCFICFCLFSNILSAEWHCSAQSSQMSPLALWSRSQWFINYFLKILKDTVLAVLSQDKWIHWSLLSSTDDHSGYAVCWSLGRAYVPLVLTSFLPHLCKPR